MRFVATLIIGTGLVTGLSVPVMAQTTTTAAKPHHAMRHSMGGMQRETVDDKGPFTPEANKAYQGGGVILEGVPGGPPPPASAAVTPPMR